MGEDCGTWIPHLQFGWQSPNSSPLDGAKQNVISATVKSAAANMASVNGTMPTLASSVLPHLQLGHSNEMRGWYYCFPPSRQGFASAANFAPEGKIHDDHVKGLREKIAPYGESSSPRRQFLVIDQTGGQTTVVYGSRFGSPGECLNSWHSKLHSDNYLSGNGPFLGRELNLNLNLNHMSEPTLADKVGKNQGTDIESEMHEDTEEINALLYSDSDGYSSEDEVTSTGHSPSTMTTRDDHKSIKGSAEEVAISPGENKKRKLSDDYHDDIHLMDTASSLNLKKAFAMENDAESRCSSNNNNKQSLFGNKKMKREKIQDVLSILKSIIPGGKDKDPVMLLDDAIHSLKSLKCKAKALGLDALENS